MRKFRIGFACKFFGYDKNYNFKTIKITSLSKLPTEKEIEKKIFETCLYNINVFNNQINEISKWHEQLKMFRIGSDFLPCYTHEIGYKIYKKHIFKELFDQISKIGEKILKNKIRISMHPGQYTMLVSKSPKVIENSIKDLEYHAEIFRMLGVDSNDNEKEINIHVGARLKDYKEILLTNFTKLSNDTQKWLSIENDEYSYSIEDLIFFKNKIKLILDTHHYWIKNNRYIQYNENIIDDIVESWRGSIPEIHYSLPKESFYENKDLLPEIINNKKSKLRAHSDYCWNNQLNDYILEFSKKFDIMVEAKAKEKAAKQLFDWYNSKINN